MNVVPGLRILRTPALIFKTQQSDLELLVLWVLLQNLQMSYVLYRTMQFWNVGLHITCTFSSVIWELI